MLTDKELKEIFLKNPKQAHYVLNGKKGLSWGKARWYHCIVYPEHWETKEDLYKDLEKFGVPCALSPLHDKDVKETGEIKKAHYHLTLYWSGQCTPYRVYTSLCGALGEDTFYGLEVVNNANTDIRYFCHLENPEKAQYNIDDIKDFNGFKSGKYLKESMVSDVDTVRQIKKIIKENNILFFNELDDFLDDNYPLLYEEFVTSRNVSRQVKDYIKGREYQMFYDGDIERSTTRFRYADGSEKVIFNRQLKQA